MSTPADPISVVPGGASSAARSLGAGAISVARSHDGNGAVNGSTASSTSSPAVDARHLIRRSTTPRQDARRVPDKRKITESVLREMLEMPVDPGPRFGDGPTSP